MNEPTPPLPTLTTRPWIALLLSLLAPGSGHLLLGRPGPALMVQTGWITILALGFAFCFATWAGFCLTLAAAGAWALGAGAHAWRLAGRTAPRPRWALATLALLALNPMVEPALVFRALPWSRYRLGALEAECMRPTLAPGDHIMLDLDWYRTRPIRRGELLAFEGRGETPATWVMRCVAVPGDVVEVRDGACLVNGSAPGPGKEPAASASAFGPRALGEGELFLLGDNRGNSYDSRFWGPLEAGAVHGRVLYRVWPRRSVPFPT